jgi:hypothetical protein
MGMIVAVDCELGLTLSHGGGYPGYGSHVLLLPDMGVGIFAFTNRSYSGSSTPVWDAAMVLSKGGYLKRRATPVSSDVAAAYRAAGNMYQQGDVTVAADQLAMNFLMDRDAAGWRRDLAGLKEKVGACDTASPLSAKGGLAGEFVWRCEHGQVTGTLLLTPTLPPRIQTLDLQQKAP